MDDLGIDLGLGHRHRDGSTVNTTEGVPEAVGRDLGIHAGVGLSWVAMQGDRHGKHRGKPLSLMTYNIYIYDIYIYIYGIDLTKLFPCIVSETVYRFVESIPELKGFHGVHQGVHRPRGEKKKHGSYPFSGYFRIFMFESSFHIHFDRSRWRLNKRFTARRKSFQVCQVWSSIWTFHE